MCADDEILALRNSHRLENLRCVALHLRHLLRQHLQHRRTGLDDLIRRQTFAQEIFARNARIAQIDVADVIHDLAVRLFRNALVKTTVSRLHVEYGNVALLRRNRAQTAIRIAKYQKRLGFRLFKNGIDSLKNLAGRHSGVSAGGIQEVIGFPEPEILEEHLVQLIVVILSGMHQNMLDSRTRIQLLHHARQPDNLRPRTHNRHHFQLFHKINPFDLSNPVNLVNPVHSELTTYNLELPPEIIPFKLSYPAIRENHNLRIPILHNLEPISRRHLEHPRLLRNQHKLCSHLSHTILSIL